MTAEVTVIDLGGVLFHFDHRRRLTALGDVLGLPAAEVDALFWGSGFSARCDAGAYRTAAEVRDRIRAGSGYRGSDTRLDLAWCGAYSPNEPLVARVAQAAGDGRRFGLLTNNGPLEEAVLPRLHPAAFAPFAWQIFSHRLGARKPEPAAFRRAGDLIGLAPDRLALLDDSEANVAAARQAGWQATRYRGSDDLAQ
jgi:putative hydrolase of the HAD superfamily